MSYQSFSWELLYSNCQISRSNYSEFFTESTSSKTLRYLLVREPNHQKKLIEQTSNGAQKMKFWEGASILVEVNKYLEDKLEILEEDKKQTHQLF